MKLKKGISLVLVVLLGVSLLIGCDTSENAPTDGHVHAYGEWESNGDGTHTKVCKKDESHTITENCSGGTATCTTHAVCSDCGAEYSEFSKTVHSGSLVWTKQAQGHTQAYECCGVTVGEKQPHNVVNGVCTVCGYDPVVGIAPVSAKAGDRNVQVIVSVGDNPGIIGMELSLTYNESIMTLKDAQSGSALAGLSFTPPTSLASGATFLWDGIDITSENIKSGEILILSFDIAADAPKGNYSILADVMAMDTELTLLSFKIQNGVISID